MRRTILLALTLLLLLCAVSQGDFSFVAWADNRPRYVENENRFLWMLQQMNHIVGSVPLFHVVPGDYDYTSITDDDIRDFSDIRTWHEAIGNHDRDAGETKGNESMDLPSGTPQARFIFLNEYQCPSMNPDDVHDCWEGRVCSHTLTWLDGECLSTPVGYPIFVVGHEPAFPEGNHVGNSLDLYPGERDAFWTLLEQYGAYYICGHTHYYSTYSSSSVYGEATQIDVGNAGNPGESNQTFVVFTVNGSNVSYDAYRIDYNVSESPKASYLNPKDGANNVPVDTVLSWIAGIDAELHNVYLGNIVDEFGNPILELVSQQEQNATSYDPEGLATETMYYWAVDELDGQGILIAAGDVWSFTTQPSYFDDLANSDIPVRGTIAGNYTDTQSSDNVYEAITERQSGGKPSKRYSYLEHKWTIDVIGGNTVTFNVEAYKTASEDGDDFVFAYSTNDSSYTDLITVWKTVDDDTPQSCPLPASISGTVYIRVTDTDQTRGHKSLDTIYIDHLYIRCAGAGEPDTEPPTPDPMTWATEPYATGSTSISMTATTASDPSGVEYYFACTAGGGHDSDWQDSPTYEDTGLSSETAYTYKVQVRDKSTDHNTTAWSIEASATTLSEVGDVVTITKAEYKTAKSELNVEATSISGGMAVLQVYDGSGNWWYGVMTYDSRKDIYKLKIKPVDDPGGAVMVTSDLGGFDTMIVTYK